MDYCTEGSTLESRQQKYQCVERFVLVEVDADCVQIVIYETSNWKEKGKMKVCSIVPVKKSETNF